MLFKDLEAALSPGSFANSLKSPFFWLCFLAGFIALLLPVKSWPANDRAWMQFALAPLLEELSWRALIQNELERYWQPAFFISWANLLVSFLFGLSHFLINGSPAGMLTFFPSLVFGMVWTRFHSLWSCVTLHLWYNTAQCLL